MSKIDNYLNRAMEFYSKNNFHNAFEYLRKIVPDEKSFDYWILTCEVSLKLNKFKEADEAISNAIHIDDSPSKVWFLKAKASIGLGNQKKALRAIKRALSIDPKEEYLQLYSQICDVLGIEDYVNIKTSTQSHIFNYPNNISNMLFLSKSQNIDLLAQKQMLPEVYGAMLDYIVEYPVNKTLFYNGDIYHKIEEFARCFVNLSYDTLEERQGEYIFNTVVVEDDLNTSMKISTLIHELAHHLLSEIFEQTVMYVFDSQKTDVIEAFAYYALHYKDEFILMNEYCAHTVECHFMPYTGENYMSFNRLLPKFDLDNPSDLKKIEDAIILGNTFALDIIYMMEQFLTPELQDQIKIQYVKDGMHHTYQMGKSEFKTNEKYSQSAKISLIHSMLASSMLHIRTTMSYAGIQMFTESFKKANRNL